MKRFTTTLFCLVMLIMAGCQSVHVHVAGSMSGYIDRVLETGQTKTGAKIELKF